MPSLFLELYRRSDYREALWRAAVLLCVVAMGCGGSQKAGTPSRPKIAKIELKGNANISDETLLDGLALRRSQRAGLEYDPYLVRADADRLRGVYLRRGYFNVKVNSEVYEGGGRARIRYVIKEGPRSRLARVEIAGLPADSKLSKQDLRELIELDDGDYFNYEIYDLAKPKLLAAVQDAGYAYAKLETKLTGDVVRHEAVIRLEYVPGPVCYFGAIKLDGVEGDLREAVLARLATKQGERYSLSALSESRDALYGLERFSSVEVDASRDTEQTVIPVAVKVRLGPAKELRLGGGVGMNPTSYEVRTRGSYKIAGWPRPLFNTFFELRPAYVLLREDDRLQPRIEALASLERLDFLRPFLKAEAEVSFSYLALEAYTSVGPRFRLGMRSPVYKRIVEVAAGWQIRLLDFPTIDPAIDQNLRDELGLKWPYLLGFYEQSIFVDLRDNAVEPHFGLYSDLRLEEGGQAAGGRFDYFRITPELRGYAPLGTWVIAARGRLGMIHGERPVTQLYFAGGASSQRGFPERQLAPTVSRTVDGSEESAVIGGGALLETGLELRFPLGKIFELPLGGVTFLDGADVTEDLDDLDLGNLHWAGGAGLRLGTPIGPVRVDLGYRLNRKGTGDLRHGENFTFHLSLGEAF